MPCLFFQPQAGLQASITGKHPDDGRGFGEITVPYVFLYLIPFVRGQGLPLRCHRSIVTIEICRPGLSLFEHDIHQDDATVFAKGTTALREKSLFVLSGQMVQGIAGVDHVEIVIGSLLQYSDHVPAKQIYTDSQRLQVVSGDIESVRGKIASAVLRHLTGAQYLADMGGISAPQVKDIERSLTALKQLPDSRRDFAVKHEVVADDLLVGCPGFAEDVNRVCFHIEDVLPFDVNPSMPVSMIGDVTKLYANLKNRRSARLNGMVKSEKQPG